jgi:hypothetical protein
MHPIQIGAFAQAFHMPSWSAKKMDATVSSFRFLGQRLLPLSSQAVGKVVFQDIFDALCGFTGGI